MSELAIRDDVEETGTALILPAGLNESEWRAVGERLGRANRASGWWIGDWINYGEDAGYVSREKYDVAAAITGLRPMTLREYAMVSRRFPNSLDRSNDLSFYSHARIARVSDASERRRLVVSAERGAPARGFCCRARVAAGTRGAASTSAAAVSSTRPPRRSRSSTARRARDARFVGHQACREREARMTAVWVALAVEVLLGLLGVLTVIGATAQRRSDR